MIKECLSENPETPNRMLREPREKGNDDPAKGPRGPVKSRCALIMDKEKEDRGRQPNFAVVPECLVASINIANPLLRRCATPWI
jgi:hypothetical protein